MVHAQCKITCAVRETFLAMPSSVCVPKTRLKVAPRASSQHTVRGARLPPCPQRCRATRRRCHTQTHLCAPRVARQRAATRATRAAAPPPRTRARHKRPSRRRRDTTTPAQEGDGIYTRTNGAGLASLEAGATVSVVGRLTGDSSIETSDGVQINLVEPSEAAQTMMPASGCVEVVGTVRDTGSVSPLRVAAFGDDFDLKNYDDLIGLAGDKYAALFR